MKRKPYPTRSSLPFSSAAVALLAALSLVACMCLMAGCTSKAPEKPAYYVFESMTIDDYTITDPNQLVMDGEGGHFEDWYFLSIALLDDENGKICTGGSVADFTYELDNGVLTIHVPLDFGYDGQGFEVSKGKLTMVDEVGTTVLRQVNAPPVPFV